MSELFGPEFMWIARRDRQDRRDEAVLGAIRYQSALDALRGNPRVDANQIYLFGHSIGSLIAPYSGRRVNERLLPGLADRRGNGIDGRIAERQLRTALGSVWAFKSSHPGPAVDVAPLPRGYPIISITLAPDLAAARDAESNILVRMIKADSQILELDPPLPECLPFHEFDKSIGL